MNRLIHLFVLFIFFAGCSSDQAPEGILPEDKMVLLLTDIHLADAYVSSVPFDSINIVGPKLYRSTFKKYSTDSVQFNKSLNYYSNHPKMLDGIYKEVKARLDILQKDEEKRERLEAKREKKLRLQYAKRYTDSIKKVQKMRLQDSIKRAVFKQRLISQ